MEQEQVERALRGERLPLGKMMTRLGLGLGVGLPAAAYASLSMPAAAPAAVKLLMGASTMLGLGIGHVPLPWSRKPLVMRAAPRARGLQLGITEDRRPFVWRDDDIVHHGLCVGMSGSGKTELFKALFMETMIRGTGGIFLDAKPSQRTLRELAAVARACNRWSELRVLTPGTALRSHTCNFLQWGDAEQITSLIVNLRKLPANAGVDFYRELQDDLLGAIVGTLKAMNAPFHWGDVLAGVVSPSARERLLKIGRWKHYTELAEVMAQYPDAGRFLEKVQGLVTLMRKYVRSDAGRIILTERGEVDLREVVRKGQLLYVALPTQTAKKSAWEWGHLVTSALSAVAGELIQLGRRPAPFLVIADEMRQYLSEGVADAYTQWREAGIGVMGALQSVAQLKGVPSQTEIDAQILANSGVKLFFRQERWEDAEAAAAELGKEITLMGSYSVGQSEGRSGRVESGLSKSRAANHGRSVRETEGYVVRPELLRGLPKGLGYVRHVGGQTCIRTPLVRVRRRLPEFEKTSYGTRTGDSVGLFDAHKGEVLTALGRLGD